VSFVSSVVIKACSAYVYLCECVWVCVCAYVRLWGGGLCFFGSDSCAAVPDLPVLELKYKKSARVRCTCAATQLF